VQVLAVTQHQVNSSKLLSVKIHDLMHPNSTNWMHTVSDPFQHSLSRLHHRTSSPSGCAINASGHKVTQCPVIETEATPQHHQ
jgi:hypothetical protein